jgi:hypothetical protein
MKYAIIGVGLFQSAILLYILRIILLIFPTESLNYKTPIMLEIRYGFTILGLAGFGLMVIGVISRHK